MPVGVPGAYGYYSTTHLLSAVVYSQSSGEKTVTIAILYYVRSGGTCHGKGTGNYFPPQIQIFSSVTGHSGFTCGSRGGMDLHNFISTDCKHSKGIDIPQITFCGEWYFFYIFKGLDIFRGYSCIIQLLAIVGNILIDSFNNILQPFKL